MAEKRMSNMDALEAKINKAEEKVVRTKAQFDMATQELKDLLDKKQALQRDELVKMIMKSSKSYDEIREFLEEGDEENAPTKSPQKRGTSRKISGS